MKTFARGAVCLLFSLSCPALQNSNNKPLSVVGIVVNQNGEAPIRKAVVALHSMDKEHEPLQTQSDTTGHFEFADVKPGRYLVTAEHQGFFASAIRGHSGGTRIEVSNTAPGDVVVRLAPAAAIRGVITDEDGDPISGIDVRAMTKSRRTGRMAPFGGQDATTDDRGEYRVHDLQPGRYYIIASPGMRSEAQNMISGKQRARMSVSTFYPGVVDRGAASEVSLGAGDELVASFTIMTAVTVHVKGTLTASSGKPATAGVVFVNGSGQSAPGSMAQVKDGAFDLQVPTGKYTLTAMAMDEDFIASAGSRIPSMARQTIEVGPEGIRDLKLSVSQAGTGKIAGRIRTEGSDKLEVQKLYVLARSTKQDDDDQSASMFGNFGSPGALGLGKVKPDGTFEIENLAAGTYDLLIETNATGLERWYVKSIEAGGRAVTSPIKIDSGATVPVTVVASPTGAQLEGIVVDADGQPLAEAVVVTLPDASLRWRSQLFHETISDPAGHFVMKGVEPGKYDVLAWDEIDNGAWNDKEYIKTVENAATSVELRESDKKRIQVKAIVTIPEATKSSQ